MPGRGWAIVIAVLGAACGAGGAVRAGEPASPAPRVAPSTSPVAAPAAAPAAAVASSAGPGPAPAPATLSTTISSAGVGRLGAGLPDDADAIAGLLPGLTVSRYDNVAESYEVHEYTALQGARRVLLVYLDLYRSGPDKVFRIAVFDPMFATATGIGVGSTIGALAERHPDTTCQFARYDPDADIYRVDRRLYCESPSLPNLTFDLDPAGFGARPGAIPVARLAARRIYRIGWLNPARKR